MIDRILVELSMGLRKISQCPEKAFSLLNVPTSAFIRFFAKQAFEHIKYM